MDSKIVRRELWKVVRPLLRDAGWTSFSIRTARRFSQSRIDVVNFQSFNSYLASAIGSTTYSFSIRLGCFFTAIPHSGIKIKGGVPPLVYDPVEPRMWLVRPFLSTQALSR
jgi:hypothetical protein